MSNERRMRGSLVSRLALGFIACVAVWAVLMYVVSETGDRRDGARDDSVQTGARSGDPATASRDDTVRVAVVLRDQTLLQTVQKSRYARLLADGAPAPGEWSVDARHGARLSVSTSVRRRKASKSVRRSSRAFASQAAWERARQHAIHSIDVRAGRRAARAQERVLDGLRRLGAKVSSRSSAPSAIVVELSADRLAAARSLDGVASVEPADQGPPLAASAGDGSPTWQTAGCTGGGAADTSCPAAAGAGGGASTPGAPGAVNSADGNGGPDVALIDTGVNLFHTAWGARSPQIVTPSRRAVDGGGADTCVGAPTVSGYWCGYGTTHGNAAAAIVGSRDASHIGMAPGVDKILDPLGAGSVNNWLSGFASGGEGPASDLPEVVNNALGEASTVDDGYDERVADMFVATLGIARSGAAGNDGPGRLGTAGQMRVASPCVAYNVLCMGAVNAGSAGRADDTPAGYSSVGPSSNGRKKPDLLAEGTAECPSTANDTDWVADCGHGTSYASARGAAALALLASAGVTNTSAQRALLINSSYMVPSAADQFAGAARYWTPDAAWGELALEQTYAHRADYALGNMTAAAGATSDPGPNSARFYRIDGMASGERVTLAWNRGIQSPNWPEITGFSPRQLTDLDLYLYTVGESDNDDDIACTATGGAVAHCGVDREEQSERLGDLDVPGDARDNVEQVRASSPGSAIVKVKAAGGIDGAASERFALAGDHAVKPLATPELAIGKPVPSSVFAHDGEPVTVTSTVTNTSSGADLNDGLALQNLDASLNAPGVDVVALVDGPPTSLAPGQSAALRWTVSTTGDALHQLTVSASGSRFGETFGGTSAPTTLTIDNSAPTATLSAPTGWQQSRASAVRWHATDALAGVVNVRVEASVDDGPFDPVYDGPDADGTVDVSAGEGQSVRTRVVVTDAAGNSATIDRPQSWSVDADPPTILIQAPAVVSYGAPATVIVRAHNVGAPVTTYVRTGVSKPFEPIEGDRFKIPSVARLGLPVKVEAQALDSMNRVARASARIKTRATGTALSLKGVRQSDQTFIQATLRKMATGTLAVSAICGRKRLRARVAIKNARTATLPLRGGEGVCKVRATFYHAASYQFASARASKRIRF